MRQRHVRALLLVCAYAVATSANYTSHGPLLGLIAREFGLSSADSGLVATLFFVGLVSTMLFGGVASDRHGPRLVVSLGFLFVALGTVATGLFSPTFAALLFWRLIGGLGAGITFAAGSIYTARAFEGRGVNLAQGLYGASFLLGSGLTLPIMPAFAGSENDWRRAYLILGLLVSLVWLAWVIFAPPASTHQARTSLGLRAALRHRNTWLLALDHMCGFGLAMVLSTWATLYLVRAFDLPLGMAGALGGLTLIAGIVARSGGGAILDLAIRPIRLIQGALILAILGLLVLVLPGSTLPVAIAGLLVTGVGVGLPYAAVFNGAAQSAPTSAGSAQAFVGWGGSLVAIFGPPALGALFDWTGSFSAGFAVLAGFVLVVLVTTLWLTPFTFRRVRA